MHNEVLLSHDSQNPLVIHIEYFFRDTKLVSELPNKPLKLCNPLMLLRVRLRGEDKMGSLQELFLPPPQKLRGDVILPADGCLRASITITWMTR